MKKIGKFLLSIVALVLVVGMVWYFANETQLNKYEIVFLEDYEAIYDELMKDEIFEIEVKVVNGKGELIDKAVVYNNVQSNILTEVEASGNKRTYQVKSYGYARISVSLEENSEVQKSIDINIKKDNVVEPTVTITDPNYFNKNLKLGMKVYIEELPILINDQKDFSEIEVSVATGNDEFIKQAYDAVKQLEYFEIVGIGSGSIVIKSTHFNKDLLTIDYQTNFNNDETYNILSLEKGTTLTADQITEYKEINFRGGSLTNLDDLLHFTFLTKISSIDSIIGNLDFSKLPMLKTIEIYNNKRNGADLIKVNLENMSNLESFNFSSALIDELSITNDTDKELDVNRLPITVSKLRLSGYEFTLLDLSRFSKLTNLEIRDVLDLETIVLNGDDIGISLSLSNLPKLEIIENILETTLDALIIDNVDSLLTSLIDDEDNFIVSDLRELSISNVDWTIEKLKISSFELEKLTLKNIAGKFSELNLNLENLEFLSLETVNLDSLIVPQSVDDLTIFNTGIKKVLINENEKLNLKVIANKDLEDIEVKNVTTIDDFIISNNDSVKNFIVDNSGLTNLYRVGGFTDKLEKVQITKTLIEDIDFSIFNKAKVINVSDNKLSEVKPFINDNLSEFVLSNNLLTSTDTISNFPQLTTLYLDNNLIELVKFSSLINLRVLHIENNKFYEKETFNYIVFNDILSKLEEITLYTAVDISSKAIENYQSYLDELAKNKNLKVNGKPIYHITLEMTFQNIYRLSSLTFNYLGELIHGDEFSFVYDENEHPFVEIVGDLIKGVGIGEQTIKLQHKTNKEISYYLKYSIKFSEQALNDRLETNTRSYTKEELNLIQELEFDGYESFNSLRELDYFEGLKKVTFINGVIPHFDFTLNNNIEEVVIINNTDENAVLIFADNQRLKKINLEYANLRSFEIRYNGLEQEITELILPKTLNGLVISGIKLEELDLTNLEVKTVSLNNSILNEISVKEQQEISNFIIENIITNENIIGFDTLKISDFTSINSDISFFNLFDEEGNLLIKTLNSLRLINTEVLNINLLNSNLTNLQLDNTMTKDLVVGKNLEELTVKNNDEITNLEINETKLKKLTLFNLENLYEIVVTNNKDLASIDFGYITYNQLTSIDVSNNKLTILPKGIHVSFMPSLSELNISYNFIEGDISSLNNLRTLTNLIVGDEKVIELDVYKKYIELRNSFNIGVVEIIEPIDILERVYVFNGDNLSNINYSEFTTYLIIQSRTNYMTTVEANFVHLYDRDLKVEFNKVNLIGKNNKSAILSEKDNNLTLIGNNTEISLVGVSDNIATINVKNLTLSGSFTISGGASLKSNVSGGTAIKANNITFENATSVTVVGGEGFNGTIGASGTMGDSGTSKDPNGKIGNQGGTGMAGTSGGIGLDISNSINVINSKVTVTGGTGGAGGKGGKGGQGGTGYSRPPQNIFNGGGNGGKGGKGGKGGNPGQGGLAFSNTTSNEITYKNGSTGNVGQGGDGGNGGRPGKGSLVTSDGNWGLPGDPGDPSNK